MYETKFLHIPRTLDAVYNMLYLTLVNGVSTPHPPICSLLRGQISSQLQPKTKILVANWCNWHFSGTAVLLWFDSN